MPTQSPVTGSETVKAANVPNVPLQVVTRGADVSLTYTITDRLGRAAYRVYDRITESDVDALNHGERCDRARGIVSNTEGRIMAGIIYDTYDAIPEDVRTEAAELVNALRKNKQRQNMAVNEYNLGIELITKHGHADLFDKAAATLQRLETERAQLHEELRAMLGGNYQTLIQRFPTTRKNGHANG